MRQEVSKAGVKFKRQGRTLREWGVFEREMFEWRQPWGRATPGGICGCICSSIRRDRAGLYGDARRLSIRWVRDLCSRVEEVHTRMVQMGSKREAAA
jgi:hypothetical protein